MKALCYLGASINIMPLSIYKKLGLVTKAHCNAATDGRSNGKKAQWYTPRGANKSGAFIFLTNFVILDCEVNFEVPIILGRPFLAIGRALVDMEKGQMKFRLNNEEVTFNICRSMREW